jgi:hypothetical protein
MTAVRKLSSAFGFNGGKEGRSSRGGGKMWASGATAPAGSVQEAAK